MIAARPASRPSTARWTRFAPATKNIVNAVRVMTVVVPEVGLLEHERDDRRDDDAGTGRCPPQKPPTFVPRLANQWAR